VLEGGGWGPDEFMRTAQDFFECPADAVEELAAVVARLAGASAAERDAAIPERLGRGSRTRRHPARDARSSSWRPSSSIRVRRRRPSAG
jgi:hypothetical protein